MELLWDYSGVLNEIQPREVGVQPRISALEEGILFARPNPAGPLPVLSVEGVDDLQSTDDPSLVPLHDELMKRYLELERKTKGEGKA